MEDREISGGSSDAAYNKLISQDHDMIGDERPLYSPQDKQQVSMSTVRPESSLTFYKQLTICLAVLAAVLLAVDIGLGVYYGKLTNGQLTIDDISREVAKLQDAYNAAVQRRDEVKKQLAQELREQQVTKWELDHQKRRSQDYQRQSDKIQIEISRLKSHMPMIEEGCRHCLPGWIFMNSLCYYFRLTEDMSRRPWQDARNFCKKQGGDLVIIDTREKHLAISELLNNYQNPSRPIAHSGFWIGLRDIEEEGTWEWTDGTRLTEGYWNEGEPNNHGNEDCAAIYPRSNPFNAWNDAPCTYDLNWICEMTPRTVNFV